MALIYDNIETKFAEGLQGIITNAGVKRVDFCVGYFNKILAIHYGFTERGAGLYH
jgi:hypothetical protein